MTLNRLKSHEVLVWSIVDKLHQEVIHPRPCIPQRHDIGICTSNLIKYFGVWDIKFLLLAVSRLSRVAGLN